MSLPAGNILRPHTDRDNLRRKLGAEPNRPAAVALLSRTLERHSRAPRRARRRHRGALGLSKPLFVNPRYPYASFPRRRVAVQVAHTEHDDVARLDPIEHAVRKPVDDCPARLAMKHLVLQRILGDPTQRSIYLGDELSSQPGPLQLVPTGGRADICFRGAPNDQSIFHSLRRMSSRASSHGSTSAGFASCSSHDFVLVSDSHCTIATRDAHGPDWLRRVHLLEVQRGVMRVLLEKPVCTAGLVFDIYLVQGP